MGLLRFAKFSSIPNLNSKIRQRTRKIEDSDIARAPLSKTEYIYSNGLFRVSSGQALNTTATFFTVSDDTIFYVTGISLEWRTTPTAVADIVRLTIGNAGQFIIQNPALNSESRGMQMGLAIPIRLTAGEVVQVQSTDVNVLARANIIGYELTLEQEKLFKF